MSVKYLFILYIIQNFGPIGTSLSGFQIFIRRNYTKPTFSSRYYFGRNYISNDIFKPSDDAFKPKPSFECGTRVVTFRPKARIIGGAESPYGAFPWQVEIQSYNPGARIYEHCCGGSLISRKLVLSAAHCFDKEGLTVDELVLILGQYKLDEHDSYEKKYMAEKLVIHPEFRQAGPHSNDIALILVKGREIILNNYIRPICLTRYDPPPGALCSVSGWGSKSESSDDISPTLHAVNVPIIDMRTCRKNDILGGREQPILDTMVCAGVMGGGIDACTGDSGGPLSCFKSKRWYLNGVVSWGSGCARKNKPGVYTRVSSYIAWIEKNANRLGFPIKL